MKKFSREELIDILEKQSYQMGFDTYDLDTAIDFLIRFELFDREKFDYEDSNRDAGKDDGKNQF